MMGKSARLRAWGDGQYAARIRRLPCAVGGTLCDTAVHSHHVRSVGAGGGESDMVPLCWRHHDELHRIGRWTFAEKYGVDLRVLADRLWSWRNCSDEGWRAATHAAWKRETA